MNQSPSQSALTTAATALRGIWAVIGLLAAEIDPWRWVDDWVGGILRRLDAMLVQFQAGTLVPAQAQPARDAKAAPKCVADTVGPATPGTIARRVCVRRAVVAAGVSRSVPKRRGARGAVPKPEAVQMPLLRGVAVAGRGVFSAKMGLV